MSKGVGEREYVRVHKRMFIDIKFGVRVRMRKYEVCINLNHKSSPLMTEYIRDWGVRKNSGYCESQ